MAARPRRQTLTAHPAMGLNPSRAPGPRPQRPSQPFPTPTVFRVALHHQRRLLPLYAPHFDASGPPPPRRPPHPPRPQRTVVGRAQPDLPVRAAATPEAVRRQRPHRRPPRLVALRPVPRAVVPQRAVLVVAPRRLLRPPPTQSLHFSRMGGPAAPSFTTRRQATQHRNLRQRIPAQLLTSV